MSLKLQHPLMKVDLIPLFLLAELAKYSTFLFVFVFVFSRDFYYRF